MKTARSKPENDFKNNFKEQPDIMALHETETPQLLYKYRSINEYAWKWVEDPSIWVSNFKDLNDPFDGALTIDFGKGMSPQSIKKMHRNSKLSLGKNRQERRCEFRKLSRPSNFAKEMTSVYAEVINSKYGMCSFSATPNQLLLWAHYADCHRGFVIGYNTAMFEKHLVSIRDDVDSALGRQLFKKIDYLSSHPKLVWEDDNCLPMSLSIKSIDWEYEEEWRLFSEKPKSTVMLTADCISSIYAGFRISPVDLSRLRSAWGKLRRINKNIKFYKMVIQESSFNILPKEIF